MPRQSKASENRLKQSQIVQLASELLKRGAKTKTVQRLTGLHQVPIRELYREVFEMGPSKGPSKYSPSVFISRAGDQLQSSIAREALVSEFSRKSSESNAAEKKHACSGSTAADGKGNNLSPAELGFLYISAYDVYVSHSAAVSLHTEPMDFESFAQLAILLSKKNSLTLLKCRRCESTYVAESAPSSPNAKTCPKCRILHQRSCVKCGQYVPVSKEDFSYRRRMVCSSHAEESHSASPSPGIQNVCAKQEASHVNRSDDPFVKYRSQEAA